MNKSLLIQALIKLVSGLLLICILIFLPAGSLEMLFVSPTHFGIGIGRKLVEYGIDNLAIERVTVNEQNPDAIGFYEHLGFRRYLRTECDTEGRPFPLIFMRYDKLYQ